VTIGTYYVVDRHDYVLIAVVVVLVIAFIIVIAIASSQR
jgi:hypothetical protein